MTQIYIYIYTSSNLGLRAQCVFVKFGEHTKTIILQFVYKIQALGSVLPDFFKIRAQGSGLSAQGSGIGAQGSRLRAQGSRLRVQG